MTYIVPVLTEKKYWFDEIKVDYDHWIKFDNSHLYWKIDHCRDISWSVSDKKHII